MTPATGTPAAPLSRVAVWTAAARPKTLFAAVSPVLVGSAMAYADGALHAPSALAALGCALLLQIGANFVNDLADFEKGSDTAARKGPLRVVQAGLVAPATMRRATVLVFSSAFALGLVLVARGGWPILAVGLAAMATAIAYTAGPRALAYVGLGDVAAFAFFGPVAVGGTYYAQALALPPVVLVAGVAPGLLAAALLVANNLRDVDEDRAAGKRTLIVRFGVTFGRALYTACLIGAALVPAGLWLATGKHAGALAASAAVLALGIPADRTVWHTREAAPLIGVLGATGRLLFVYGVAFALGWALT